MRPTTFEEFWNTVSQHGLEGVGLFYGLYRATVTDNKDPEGRGRVKLLCPAVHREPANVWVLPSSPGAGANHGSFNPPDLGDTVYVCFVNGDPRRPECYFPGFYGYERVSEVPSELTHQDSANKPPYRRGMVTRRGMALVLDETPGAETLQLRWRQPSGTDDPSKTPARATTEAILEFQTDGSFHLKDKHGNELTFSASGITLKDTHGNELRTSAAGITLKSSSVSIGDGANQPLVLGSAFLTAYNAHTHPTAIGPTATPVPPLTPSVLSSTHKTK